MPNPVVHWQIITTDPERLADFYERLFDWEIDDDNPMGYRRVHTGSDRGVDGGLWPAPPEGHDFVQMHVEVQDVAASVSRAEELGGEVIVSPQVLPEGDEMAVIHDPMGVPLVLYRPAGG